MHADSQISNARIQGVIVTLAVVVVLYLGRAVFIPIALAVLLSFVIGPLVKLIERLRVGRILSVVGAIVSCSILLATLSWFGATQLVELSSNLPNYKSNLIQRVEDFRNFAPSGFASMFDALSDIEREVMESTESDAEESDERTTTPESANVDSADNPTTTDRARGEKNRESEQPKEKPVEVEVVSTRSSAVSQLLGMINPVLGPIGTFGIVIVLTIFILLDREDFRNRIIQLLGSSNLAIATRAINEASDRSITWLRTMVFINSLYGIAVTTGLYFLGLPNAFLWGGLAFFCRFVPYVGPWIGATLPVILSLAVFQGWTLPLGVIALYILLEVIVNTVLEPWLYGKSLGLTSIGIILAAIFWTYLWGPAGLLIAVPITMWLAVLGHHVPQMSAFTILFGDMSEMPSYHSLYQRLLAFDAEEAETIMDGHFKIDHASEIMEHVFSPLFAKLELDRLAGFIEAEQKDFAYQTIAGYVKERVEKVHLEKQVKPSDQTNPNSEHEPRQPKVSVVIIPTGNEPEEIMSEMLHLSCLTDLDLDIHTTSSSLLVNQIVKNIETNSFDAAVFCCGSAASEAKTRLICKRIANFDQKLPVFVFKSNQGRHSIAMTTDGLPGPDNRFDTIAKVLEKLGHVNRRLPQSNENKAEASNLSSMKPNGLAIV